MNQFMIKRPESEAEYWHPSNAQLKNNEAAFLVVIKSWCLINNGDSSFTFTCKF